VQTSDVDGSYSLTATDVPAGDHEVTATETVRGTESAHSPARTVHVDRTAPAPATVSGTTPTSPASSRTPAVRGTAEPSATVDVYGAAQCTGPVIGTGTGSRFPAGITASVPANTASTLSVRQTDLAGNAGPCSSELSYVHDSVPPAAPVLGGQTPSGTVAQTSATITFSLAEPGTAQCRLDGGAFAGCSSPTTYASLGAGAHTVDVRLIDVAGNIGPVASRTWTVDTTGPTAALADTQATALATTTPSFAFQLSEPGTARCALLPVQPSLVPCTSPATFGTLANGSYTLQVQGTDLAGNAGPVASIPVTVDTVAPPVAILAGPTGPVSGAISAFTFASTDPTATFACGIAPDGAPVPALSPCTSPAQTPTLPTGTFRFFVRSTDAAGNVTLTSRRLVVDRTAPARPAGVVARTVSRSSIALRWRPVGDSTAVVYRVFRDGARTATTVVRGTSWTDVRLRPGVGHSYRVVAVDAAGNSSTAATVLGVTAGDTVRPRVTVAPRVSFGQRVQGRATVTVRWNASDAGLVAAFTLWQRSGSGAWHRVALPTATARSVTLHPAAGTYTFRVQATDVAGNRSPVVTGSRVSVR
jgi:hypothetical protein